LDPQSTIHNPPSRTLRVATCTPVAFPADEHFYARDSGLLCRGFQAAGAECMVVMPGDSSLSDAPDLVRCRNEDLSDPTWWKSLNLNLVVLYAWGDPVYRPVADAIREAGITLIQGLDTAGLHTPYGNKRDWWRCLISMLAAPQPHTTKIRLLAKAVRDFIPALYERSRLDMMARCDRLAVVSPPAARSITDYVKALGQTDIARKILVLPHPVASSMQPFGVKTAKVLVVGRWRAGDRAQKDPELTLAVLRNFLETKPEWRAEVVGVGSENLNTLTGSWSEGTRSRLLLTDFLSRDDLLFRYQESRILLCCSRFESFHISSAEALCCGCSIVVADHPLLASTGWFTTRESGAIAGNRDAFSLTEALRGEAAAWLEGRRNSVKISENWIPTLHAKNVALSILDKFKNTHGL